MSFTATYTLITGVPLSFETSDPPVIDMPLKHDPKVVGKLSLKPAFL